MTPAAFRKLALSLEGASEGAHGGHADFRAGGKVFATMGYPDKEWAMVKLTPDQQRMLCDAEPGIFRPVKGAWGLQGSTHLKLSAADRVTARSALAVARQNVVAKRKSHLVAK
jgi:YjbR